MPFSIETVGSFAVQAGTVIIMFCVGAGLDAAALAHTLRRPRPIIAGLILQLLVMPLLAMALCRWFESDSLLSVGLVVAAACPISAPSNLLARLARGSVALSVTLTSLTSLLSAITVPLALALMDLVLPLKQQVSLPPLWRIAIMLFLLAALPALAGMAIRALKPGLIAAVDRQILRVAVAAFIIGLALAIAGVARQIPASLYQSGPLAILLNIVGLAVAFWSCVLLRLPSDERIAILLGTGTRKFSFAAIITIGLMHDPRLLMPAIAYGLLMWIPAVGIVAIARGLRPVAGASPLAATTSIPAPVSG